MANEEEFFDNTHILDIWLKDKFNWTCANWCIITEQNEILIWLMGEHHPTLNQLKMLSDILYTDDITVEPIIISPIGGSILDMIHDREEQLDMFVFSWIRIKNWNLDDLKSYYIKKQLELNLKCSEDNSDKLLTKMGLV